MRLDLPPWAEVSDSRRDHVERVAELLATWAQEMRVSRAERLRWLRAAFLHDALRDAGRDMLTELAPDWVHTPNLQHGPAAAALAEAEGESDRGILDAVRYHSMGYDGWDEVGRMLYLADYLEPGRRMRRRKRRALARLVPEERDGVLRYVARKRLRWTINKGKRVLPESVGFWNGLVAG